MPSDPQVPFIAVIRLDRSRELCVSCHLRCLTFEKIKLQFSYPRLAGPSR